MQENNRFSAMNNVNTKGNKALVPDFLSTGKRVYPKRVSRVRISVTPLKIFLREGMPKYRHPFYTIGKFFACAQQMNV